MTLYLMSSKRLLTRDVYKRQFESYYTRSPMMQSLYCNETDTSGQLVPIYLEIGDKKYIATWSNDGENDTFTYRDATIEERGTLDILWEIFGGTVNSKGYKVLDPHIGMVYGDAITLERCESICNHMTNLGYAVENVVFGAGSYSFQYNTRDTQGWACLLYTSMIGVEKWQKLIFYASTYLLTPFKCM